MRAAALEAQGYGFSCDMLGEAARTEADARRYLLAHSVPSPRTPGAQVRSCR